MRIWDHKEIFKRKTVTFVILNPFPEEIFDRKTVTFVISNQFPEEIFNRKTVIFGISNPKLYQSFTFIETCFLPNTKAPGAKK